MDERRLERLEERVAWLERHLGEQDKAMLELSEELQRLKREVAVWRERVAARDAADQAGPSPADERPPHY
jgi:SlyX protein